MAGNSITLKTCSKWAIYTQETAHLLLLNGAFTTSQPCCPLGTVTVRNSIFLKLLACAQELFTFCSGKNILYTHKKFENIVFFTVTVPLSTSPGVAEGFQGKKWKIE